MNSNWFPFVYAFVLGLLTGLLEQGANWLAFKLSGEMGKTWGSALGLGLGHGGMESIYAVGIPLLLTVIQVINLQANGVESLNLSAADAARRGGPVSSLAPRHSSLGGWGSRQRRKTASPRG